MPTTTGLGRCSTSAYSPITEVLYPRMCPRRGITNEVCVLFILSKYGHILKAIDSDEKLSCLKKYDDIPVI